MAQQQQKKNQQADLHQQTHSALHPLREQEPLVDGADGVVGLYITLPLEQDWSGVQSIVSPEHGEPSLLVPVDQGPGGGGGQQTCDRYHDIQPPCDTV